MATGAISAGLAGSALISIRLWPVEQSYTLRYSRSFPEPGSPWSSACPRKQTAVSGVVLPSIPVRVPVPWKSIMFTLTGGALSDEPLQPMTVMFRPLKCNPSRWSTTFQLPPPAAVGLQPGLTTPPKLKSGWPFVLPTVPPPVSQHVSGVGGGNEQMAPLNVKLTSTNSLLTPTRKADQRL